MRRSRVTTEESVACPWCGHDHRDGLEAVRAGDQRTCEHCARPFDVVATWTVRTFVTETPAAAQQTGAA